MSIEEINNEINTALALTINNEVKINLLEAMLHTVCLSEYLNYTESVEYAYRSIVIAKELTLKDCDIDQLALLSNALIGALSKNYI